MTYRSSDEIFVARFYQSALSEWNVWPQMLLRWPDNGDAKYLPTMRPDLTLEHKIGRRSGYS